MLPGGLAPQHVALPPVGRHTSALEGRVRKNSLSDVPDTKKPKLELSLTHADVDMPGTITPGASIEDSFESPVDAEIPHSAPLAVFCPPR